jgi:hypothetical protein
MAAILLAATSGAFAQQTPYVAAQTQKAKSSSVMDFSLGIFGQLTPARTPTETADFLNGTAYDQTVQRTSPSVGVLGTFHQSFRSWLGYSVNFGYSRFSEQYSQGTYFPNPSMPTQPISSFSYGAIGTNMYELTGAYLIQRPRAKRFDTFGQLGGGILSFLPMHDPSPYAVQFRPTMLFGAGINYKLSKHWELRAEYRGLFLKNPDFHGEGASSVPVSKLFTVTNEPTMSIVYRFGGKR